MRASLYEELRGALDRAGGAGLPVLARAYRKTPQKGTVIAHSMMKGGARVTPRAAGAKLKERVRLLRGLVSEAAASGSFPLLAFPGPKDDIVGKLLRGGRGMEDLMDSVFGYRPRGGDVPGEIDVPRGVFDEMVAPRHAGRGRAPPRGMIGHVVLGGLGAGELSSHDDSWSIGGVDVIGDSVAPLPAGMRGILAAARPGAGAPVGLLSVAVVGAGRLGSHVAAQLIKLRPRRILLVDRAEVTREDVPWARGAAAADIGRPRAEVLRDRVVPGSGVRVDADAVDATEERARYRIACTDAVISCTNDHACRASLNDLALRHYVPLVDAWCGAGGGRGQEARVQVVTAENACLWCTGALDREKAAGTRRPRGRRRRGRAAAAGGRSGAPMEALAASVAVHKLLCAFGEAGPEYGTRVVVDPLYDRMDADRPGQARGCACAEVRGVPLWAPDAPFARRATREKKR